MTEQIVDLRVVLNNKRVELVRSIRLQSVQLSVGEGEHELLDRIQGMSRREEAVSFLDALNRALAAVDAALQAVEEGVYGDCVECGDTISSRRLAAIRWASRCIRCQQELDRRTERSASLQRWYEAPA